VLLDGSRLSPDLRQTLSARMFEGAHADIVGRLLKLLDERFDVIGPFVEVKEVKATPSCG